MPDFSVSLNVNQITVDSTNNVVTVTESPTQVLVNTSTPGRLTTDDVMEGVSPYNLYFTNARARSALSGGTGITYNSTSGQIAVTTGYAQTQARTAISVADAGGDGSLAYNNTTGVITYTGPSATEVRNHFSAGTGISITNGVITNSQTPFTQSNARAAISVVDNGGDGSLTYSSGTGVISYTGPSASETRAHFSAGTGVTLNNGQISIGQAVGTNNNVTFNNATINGNLQVNGTTTTVDQETLSIADNKIILNSDVTGAPTLNAFFEVNRGTSADVSLRWNESTDKWEQTRDGTTYTVLPASTSELPEGTNLYYTDQRVSDYLAENGGGGGYDQDLNTTDSVTFVNVSATQFKVAQGADDARGYTFTDEVAQDTGMYSEGDGQIQFYNNANKSLTITDGNITLEQGSLTSPNNISVVTSGADDIDLYTNDWNGDGVEVWLRHNNCVDINTANGTYNWKFDNTGVLSMATGYPNDRPLILQGDQIQFNTNDVDSPSKTLSINSLGYNFDLNDSGNTFRKYVRNNGTFTKTLKSYLILGDGVTGPGITIGSNQVTNVYIFDINEDPDILTPLDWTTVDVVGQGFFDDNAFYDIWTSFPDGTKISSVSVDPGDSTLATLTLSNNAVDDFNNLNYDIFLSSHMAYSDDYSVVISVDGWNGASYDANTIVNTGFARLPYGSGYVDAASAVTDNFSWTNTGTVIDAGARRVINLEPASAINEHINIPWGLGVGPGAVVTNRGLPNDLVDSIGINLLNNGKIAGYTGKVGLNLTQYKNNSIFDSGGPAERSGPNFTFNSFAGDVDTSPTSLYLTSGDGLGQITWFAQPASSSLASSTYTPASITAKATETHSSATTQGTGLYLQYTPNSNGGSGRPRTFLRAENTTTEVLANTTLKLGKFDNDNSTTTKINNNRTLSNTAAATWATIDDTSAAFTVPVKFPVYTKAQAAAITGSMGMQICISDSAGGSNPNGMMAFWDTTNSRWSYVHDNNAL